MNEKLRDDLIGEAKQFESQAKKLQCEVIQLRKLAKMSRLLAAKFSKSTEAKSTAV